MMEFYVYKRLIPLNRNKGLLHCKECGGCLDHENNIWGECPHCTDDDHYTSIKDSLEFSFKYSEDVEVRREAAYKLGCYYIDVVIDQGNTFDRNLGEAVSWFVKAADLGHIDAMYRLTMLYSEGTTELELVTAFTYIDKIREKSHRGEVNSIEKGGIVTMCGKNSHI